MNYSAGPIIWCEGAECIVVGLSALIMFVVIPLIVISVIGSSSIKAVKKLDKPLDDEDINWYAGGIVFGIFVLFYSLQDSNRIELTVAILVVLALLIISYIRRMSKH